MSDEHMVQENTVEQSSKEQVLDGVINAAKAAVGKKKRQSPVRVNSAKINQWCSVLRTRLDKLFALEPNGLEPKIASRIRVCFIWLRILRSWA